MALRVCELHGTELRPDTVEVIDACVDYADWYVEARTRLFPNVASGLITTEGIPLPCVSTPVWYCQECRDAEVAWRDDRARRALPTGLRLTRPTTLDEYEVGFGAREYTGGSRDKWRAFRSEVEAELARGGNLWEWEVSSPGAPDAGTGLVVVRDGQPVRHWQLWRS